MLWSHSSPQPDKFTFPFVLKACAALDASEEAREAHGRVLRTGLHSDVYVSTALVDLYMKLGEPDNAHQVFVRMAAKNSIAWNAMIAGYAYNGLDMEAVSCFKAMIESGVELNSSTMVCVLPAIARLGALDEGRLVHKLMEDKQIEMTEPVRNSLIDMYGKCGELGTALILFEDMPEKSVVSWNIIISTYAHKGEISRVMELFDCMRVSGIEATAVTAASILPACADLVDLKLGMAIHGYCTKKGFDGDIVVRTALLDMYAKCGSMEDAKWIFDEIPERNIITWNAMICGYGLQGQAEEALELLSHMHACGTEPNQSTFVSALSACSHGGLVEEGLRCFDSMSRNFNLTPEAKHYACIVDLLGRAGRLTEACNLIRSMPVEPDDAVWGSLLGACRIHRQVELGEIAAKKALELKPEEAGYYVLLANIYADADRWAEAQKLREMMRNKNIRKEAGSSFIEEGGTLHSFVVGDCRHPCWEEIHRKMVEVEERVRVAGYVPDTGFVLQEDRVEKDGRLSIHSERIALAFGLLKVGDGVPIRIAKNLRVCGDCHALFKLVSRVYRREIIVRDKNRFHRFRDGSCSCKDYW
ncbi:hypothetical protein Taro_029139 [Colocasia esculenta]|uniref:DYW domain-containing protein n=1 Tax=Colocasia esculenta TaxID=4460 RepID=A0A843VZE6_COLES|nr:hypothetical protein [Colocasia esculenta]